MLKIIKDERGSVLEFVITMPILLAIILIGIMLIMLSYSKIAAGVSAREAARNYAVTAHEVEDSLRLEQAKEIAVDNFQAILPLKNVYINKDSVEINTDTPLPGYISATVTAYVPLVAPGMGKILDKNSNLFSNRRTIEIQSDQEGGEVRTRDVLSVKGHAVFKEEIDINT